jgi:hypothetical protein
MRGVFGGVSDSQARIWSREAIGPPRRSSPMGGGEVEARDRGTNESGVVELAPAEAEPGAVGGGDETIAGTKFCERGRRLEREEPIGREDGTAPAVAGRTLPRMLLVRCGGDSIVSTATACSDVLSCEVTGRNRTALRGRDAGFALASHMLMADNAFSCGSSFEPPSSTRKAWLNGTGLLVMESACEGELLGSEA